MRYIPLLDTHQTANFNPDWVTTDNKSDYNSDIPILDTSKNCVVISPKEASHKFKNYVSETNKKQTFTVSDFKWQKNLDGFKKNILSLCERQRFSEFNIELQEIKERCKDSDWDGYNAHSLCSVSVENAEIFCKSLPYEISLPELCPEPTGELGMSWTKNGYNIAFSIDKNNNMTWGGITPNGSLHGHAKFNRSNIPSEVLSILKIIEDL